MFGTTIGTTIGNPIGAPLGSTRNNDGGIMSKDDLMIKPPPKKKDTPRAHNFAADYGGCGHWRLFWPSLLLCGHQKVIVHSSSTMVMQDDFYKDLKCVRLQRQVAPHQRKFFDYLKTTQEKHKFNLCYEIDDVFIYEDIPDYNKFKEAYKDPAVKRNGLEIMAGCDEVTVTCDYMKDYYSQYVKNITVIPNYIPRFWMDRFYDDDLIAKNFDRHVKKRKKPRVLYAASGAHFDVDGRAKYKDDFTHVNDVIRKTVNKFQWVFLGAFPMNLKDLVKEKKIEYHPWTMIPDYPQQIHSLKINAVIAPLQDNVFNRCKSDLKYIEASAFGLPSVCQDMVTYSEAPLKFKTGDDLIDNLNNLFSDKNVYMKASRKARAYADTRWLEDHIDMYEELYTTPYGSPRRKSLNNIQS